MDKNYELLAAAVIEQAISDYRRALRGLRYKPKDFVLLQRRCELERFFLSPWFAVLSDIDGRQLLILLLQGG